MAAVFVAALTAACSGPAHISVELLPAPSASGHRWHWTGQCPVGPAIGSGCQRAGPILGFGQLNGDEWNLGGTGDSGSLDASVTSRGGVTFAGRFTSAPPCTAATCLAPSASTWVRGYPDVSYGVSQCHASTSPPSAPQLPLPMRVDAIPPGLIGVTAYSAEVSGITYDVAYDLWLHQTGTKQPCLSDGSLEIMVWTDYDARALLPAGLQIATASVPFAVGAAEHPGTNSWSVYASNIYRGGRTAPWGGTLWFVPGQADAVGAGRVSVDLTAVLSDAGTLLRDDYGWPDFGRHYWLDTAPFGVEFGPASGTSMDGGPAQFSVQISRYCLDVRTTPADATCS